MTDQSKFGENARKRKIESAAGQKLIDYGRGDQLGLLREMRLELTPAPDGVNVSGSVLMAVLRMIDELAGYRPGQVSECWASAKTIADCCGFGKRQTVRAIDVLESLSLITKETKWNPLAWRTLGHYRIVWNELALLIERDRQKCSERARPKCNGDQPMCNHCTLVPPDQSAMETDQSAMETNRSAMETNRSATVAPNPPIDPQLSATTRLAEVVVEISEISVSQIDRELAGAVAAILERAGLSRPNAIALAREHPLTEPEADQISRTYLANRRLFSGPGAIDWRVRTGVWPATGVRDAPTQEQLVAARERQRVDQDRTAAEAALAERLEREQLAAWQALSDEERAYWIDEARARNRFLSRMSDDSLVLIDAAMSMSAAGDRIS